MKLSSTAIVSTLALLALTTVQACPTLKFSGKRSVVGGKSGFYTVKVSTGATAVTGANLTVSFEGGNPTHLFFYSLKPNATITILDTVIGCPSQWGERRLAIRLAQRGRGSRAGWRGDDLAFVVSGREKALHLQD